MTRVLRGAIAGVAATGPMTLAIEVGRRLGPPAPEQPKEVSSRAGAGAAWGVAHAAMGAALGATYTLVRPLLPRRATGAGAVYGAAVWAANYGGLVPAAGLYPPPWRDLRARVASGIASHLVYGIALSALEERL